MECSLPSDIGYFSRFWTILFRPFGFLDCQKHLNYPPYTLIIPYIPIDNKSRGSAQVAVNLRLYGYRDTNTSNKGKRHEIIKKFYRRYIM